MRKTITGTFIILFLLLAFAQAQETTKPYCFIFSYFINNGEDGLHLAYSEDGYHWQALNNGKPYLKPAVGNDKLMRDPCIIRGNDGKFHMVWTVSWTERSIGYASSDDLINWSQQQAIPVMENDTTVFNAWAPEIFYQAKTKKYMIFWASAVAGRFTGTGTSADKYNHRIYYVTTKDFKKFTSPALLYNKGFSVIDATIQQNGNEYLMVLKNENDSPAEKNIRIASSKKPDRNYSMPSAPITGNYWAEGPTVLKKDNKWIVYFDKYNERTYGAVESADLKHWKDISDRISIPKGLKHGTILQITQQELEKLKRTDTYR